MSNDTGKWKDVYLQFDFHKENNGQNICFTNPEMVIETYELDEVIDCLQLVEQAHNKGKYIAGYMNFEASYALFNLPITKQTNRREPLLWFGVFDKPSEPGNQANMEYTINHWTMRESKQSYIDNVTTILEAIKKNTFTQINYTTMWEASFQGDPMAYYNRLKKAQQSNYCAYIKNGHQHILSISPELFFRTHNRNITVRPMKGTIHRGRTFREDEQLKNWLATSRKNQFENELTTNLMKDELKAITVEDSLHVTKQFTIEKYPTVYQMTSEITGELIKDMTIANIFTQLFPCTSIAGTPKKETLRWIDHLEANYRHIYCGTVGYIKPNSDAVFNVAIRTLLYDEQNDKMTYGAGGAITAKSSVEEEYNEVITKTAILHCENEDFSLLETIGLFDGKIFLLQAHLRRLKESAAYYSFSYDEEMIIHKLHEYKETHSVGKWRIRLLLNNIGEVTTEINELDMMGEQLHVRLANEPIDQTNTFHYHKTTNRKIYDTFKKANDDVFDVLLWNERNEITEFTIGNIVIEMEGELLTPPLSVGILAGTFRQHLLNREEIKEAILTKADVEKATNIWLINSVRKWVPVQLQK